MAKIKLRQDDAIFAIRTCLGNLSDASERLGVCRQTLYTFAKTHPKVQEAIAHGRAVIVDKAERKLVEAIEDGERWAVSLVLRTLGKWRGYIEAKDLTPRGQCRLPQGDGVDAEEDDWGVPAAYRRDSLEASEDDAADEDLWRQQEALIERQHEQLAAQAAQLEAQAARIRELEAATAQPNEAEVPELALRTEIQSLMEQVRRKLGENHPA
jgi:hypothetical protein